MGSVHTKPTSLLSSLGPQSQEGESEEEEEPVVVSEEVMIEILASVLGYAAVNPFLHRARACRFWRFWP